MESIGIHNESNGLEKLNLDKVGKAYWNLAPAELVEMTIRNGQGKLAGNGALVVETGEFTGRSPKDRFIVKDERTDGYINWGEINIPFQAEKFDQLFDRMQDYLKEKTVFVRDAYACADPEHRLNVRVIGEYPWQNIFVHNMFLRPEKKELKTFEPDWHVISVPSFTANAEEDDTRQHNFAIINFTRKMILIGGTAYTGEIKKGIFSVLNFLLPHDKNILSMHCSANMGREKGDTAIFFGLSGTGKTTLSTDPNRNLIGDDEHGWSEDSVFNFEGGSYAKVINLSAEGEPQIFNAIQFGALMENTKFHEGTRDVDYADSSVTENTRVSYPIHYIENSLEPSVGDVPQNIFMLTCDAFGVLPPISKLSKEQAMYHFISGYTAKVAGTEEGITEPKVAFSACFGAPFMPLHPTRYAEMLGKKMEANDVNVWLVNTGWTGGPYGEGARMKLKYTRATITAALNGELDKVKYMKDPIFGLAIPTQCPNVPENLLNPRTTWDNMSDYDKKANELAQRFNKNFRQFEAEASQAILNAAPKANVANV